MIRRVRRQFICITMAMLTAVLLVPLIALNVVTEAMSYNQTRNLLEQIAISETTVPELPDDMPPDGKQPRQSTDTATETGTSAAETTAETTTETTATETAAAETTAKAAPAEQPKNPVQTQAPAVQSPVQTTAAPRTTAAPQTRATTTARTTSPRATKPAVTRQNHPSRRRSRILIRRPGGDRTNRITAGKTKRTMLPQSRGCSMPHRWRS